jgi:hypothetical protein
MAEHSFGEEGEAHSSFESVVVDKVVSSTFFFIA